MCQSFLCVLGNELERNFIVIVFFQIKDIRNCTMHSATLEVEDADMVAWLDKIISLLEDPKYFDRLPACKTAVDRIKEVSDTKSRSVRYEMHCLQRRLK